MAPENSTMKNYIKHLIAGAILAAATPIIASAQCKYVKESKDAFSGEAVKKATDLALGPWMWTVSLEQKGDKYFIGMKVVTNGDVRYVIPKGDKIMIKLENEKFVELEMQQDYPPVAQVYGTSILTLWVTKTEVEAKMMKRLARSPITDVKVVVQGVDLVLPKVKEKQVNAIMNSAACIMGITDEAAK